MTNLWTIAILTVTGREHFLERLRGIIDAQVEGKPVDIMVIKDNRERTIGEKRQLALDLCKTRYISFIDDDDIVSTKYVQLILNELKSEPTGIGFRGIITTKTNTAIEFVHKAGLKYSEKPEQYMRSLVYTRPLNHLNPVLTDIAREIGFKPISDGEDWDYSLRLAESGLITDQIFIDEFLYFYQYRGKDKI